MPALITFQDVYKIYAMEGVTVPAINGVSLEINQGDFVGLIGPSGSGKIEFMILGLGLLFAFIVGIVSGVLPAYQASKMKPVDALRYE